jgi:tetratricopeptide (TPR) repeat protein
MKTTSRTTAFKLIVTLGLSAAVLAQTPAQQQPEFVKQAQQLMKDGKPEAALAVYRQTLQSSPNSVPANLGAGSVLDLMGKGDEARKYFAKAIEAADTPEGKARAKRAMAISYAFEGNCGKTVEYEGQVIEFYASKKDFFQQGEIADEAARVCLDSGDLGVAYKWYKTGHDTGLEEPDIKPARRDLWDFRWEHAQARIAARRGEQAEAQKHVASAKAVLDKGTNPEQAQFLPYLKGYVVALCPCVFRNLALLNSPLWRLKTHCSNWNLRRTQRSLGYLGMSCGCGRRDAIGGPACYSSIWKQTTVICVIGANSFGERDSRSPAVRSFRPRRTF